jgi:hypothetical protein
MMAAAAASTPFPGLCVQFTDKRLVGIIRYSAVTRGPSVRRSIEFGEQGIRFAIIFDFARAQELRHIALNALR